MDGEARRALILDMIRRQGSPVGGSPLSGSPLSGSPLSASAIAQALSVSRQVVVGDVALLRAQGQDIIATARGYIIPAMREAGQYVGKLACQHPPEETRAELYALVDLGALVLSVMVEHEVYGEITGNLNLACRADVDLFMDKVEGAQAKLLSELTQGIHLHGVACRDAEHFERIRAGLSKAGYLFRQGE